MIVCLLCLKTIDTEDMVILNRSETYHSDCHCKLINIRERKNKLSENVIDITDSLVVDSEDPVQFNIPWIDPKWIDENKEEEHHNHVSEEIFLNNNIINEINNIFTGPDFATDYAGNQVKLDKKYIANHKLKSMGVKYKF